VTLRCGAVTTKDDPVSRGDFERAVRSLHLSDLDLRDALLKLAAQVVSLTDELTRRLDGVEPLPAPPNTPAVVANSGSTFEHAIHAQMQQLLPKIRAADVNGVRVQLDTGDDKYTVTPADIPCAELLHLCHARCCSYSFSLSSADLDEGIIRWDYGQPYLIRQRASDGYCVHNDATTRHCTVHHARPRVCREYDCRDDKRVWIDFANRIPAPLDATTDDDSADKSFDLLERARERALAVRRESLAITSSFADGTPKHPTKR